MYPYILLILFLFRDNGMPITMKARHYIGMNSISVLFQNK